MANDGRFLYFLKFPGQLQRSGRESDVLFALVFPLDNAGVLKEFVLRQLNLKSASPEWRVVENISPGYVAVSHKSEHVSIGFDDNCLVALTSWWSDVPSPTFLDAELRDIFARAAHTMPRATMLLVILQELTSMSPCLSTQSVSSQVFLRKRRKSIFIPISVDFSTSVSCYPEA